MPIYAYRCEACGHAKDVLQKMSDPVLTECPACGAAAFKKQLTAAGFQLKGSGWYVTDFRGGAGAASAGGEGAKEPAVPTPATAASTPAAPVASAAPVSSTPAPAPAAGTGNPAAGQ